MRKGLTLYCIRHGETDWNKERRYQGQRDIPLNNVGRAQASDNGRKLASLNLALDTIDFVASPLQRAQETMQRIRTELDLPPNEFATEPRIKEVHYGVWEGSLLSELSTKDPEGLAGRRADPFYWRAQDGESYAQLLERTVEWLETVERDAIVVTHGGVSRVLRCHALGLDPNTILELEVPQDHILILRKNEMHWL